MPDAPFRHLALLGVGLIGGSLGLALKARHPGLHITGYDAPEVLDRALARGAVDARAATPADAVAEADVVVLAAPLSGILRLLGAVAPHLRPGTVVTDVGSVKAPVMAHAREVLPGGVTFVGGHPMAGAAQGGIDHADALLFENATYVLCPPEGDVLPPALVALVRATGAHVLALDAARHDRIAAAVSHLPQLLAVALMDHAATLHADDDAVLRLAAGGFRDMTRIAASPFGMWRDILVANHGTVLDALGSFAAVLQRLRNRLAEEDLDAVGDAFVRAAEAREGIPRHTKGFLHPLADVYVYAVDRPGELLRITRTLFDAGLDVKDMELLKVREGTGGAFRLGFAAPADAAAAEAALREAGFDAFQR